MKSRPCLRNPFKEAVLRLIRGTTVDAETIRRAYLSLQEPERDCMRYVPYLLRLEGCKEAR